MQAVTNVTNVAVLTDVLDHVGANWLLFQLLHKVFLNNSWLCKLALMPPGSEP